MEWRTLEVDGIPMRWQEAGSGRPVVYLHGIPTSPRLWRRVVPLVPEARSLAWEMVGYGGSAAAGQGRDIAVARQADYLEKWLRALDLEEVVLVGHDLGGGVAQIAAVAHPQRIAGLVLTNAISYDSWPVPQVKMLRTAAPVVEKLPTPLFRLIFTAFMRMGHDRPSRARESLREHWPFYAAGDGPGAFVRQLRSLDVRDTLAIADRLPKLNLPARIVWGAADQFQEIGYGYRLAHDLKAPLTRIDDGKHFVPEDHPEEVARAVQDLLRQLDTAPRA